MLKLNLQVTVRLRIDFYVLAFDHTYSAYPNRSIDLGGIKITVKYEKMQDCVSSVDTDGGGLSTTAVESDVLSIRVSDTYAHNVLGGNQNAPENQ